MKFLEGLSDYIFETLGVALGVLILAIFYKASKWVRSRLKSNTVEAQMAMSLRIQDDLSHIRTCCGTSRAYLFQFVNGSFYTSNISQLKMVCTHQSLGPGVSPIEQRNDFLLSHAPQFMHEVEKGLVYSTFDQIVDTQLRVMLEQQGVQSIMCCPVFGARKTLVGFVGLDYVHTDVKNIDEAKDALKKLAGTISYELTR